jgi:hypothetical protein
MGIRDNITMNVYYSLETWIEEGEMLGSSDKAFLTKSVTNPSTCSFGVSLAGLLLSSLLLIDC